MEVMKMNKNRIFAVGVVALLLSVAVATPVLMQDSSATEDELYSDATGDSYGVLPLIPFASAYLIKSFIKWGAVGFVAGLIVGNIATIELANPASDQEEVHKQLREMKAEDLKLVLDTIANISGNMIPADTTLWTFTSSYWNRATELVVAEFWDQDVEYNPEAVTHRALLRTNIENYLYNWQASIDKSYNNVLNNRKYMVGDCWGDLAFNISWAQGSEIATADSATPFYLDLTQYVKGAPAHSTVYIDANHWDSAGTYDVSTSGTIYNLGTTSVTLEQIKVYDSDMPRNTIEIGAGESVQTKNTDTGLYEIVEGGAFIAGPLTMAASDNAAEVGGCLVFNSGTKTIYALPSDNNVVIGTSGLTGTVESSRFELKLTYTGTKLTESVSPICGSTKNVDNVNLIRDWDLLVKKTNTIVGLADEAGETLWGIFDAAQKSNSFLSPSSVTTTVEGVDLTVAQQQAIYIQAMTYIGEYWKENGGILTEAEFITNLESIGLMVHGDIYYNGQLWMEDAIFTPYMTVSAEQELITGSEVKWSGSGFAMVWAQKESLADWNGDPSVDQHYLMNLDSNYSIVVNEIEKDGVPTGKVILTPTIIDRATGDPDDPSELPEPVKVLDGGTLIMIIMIELAIILFLIGYLLGQPMIGAIVAIIVILLALVASETVASIFLGTFSWSGLFSF